MLTEHDKRLLHRIRDTIHAIEPTARVILYGSRARGEAQPDSDWDLLIRRRTLHARSVTVLEDLVRDRLAEQVERLAHHALRGEVWDKALAYCRQAGARAMARSAYQEAVTAFEQALVAFQHLPDSPDLRAQAIDLHLALRTVLLPLWDFRRVHAYLCEAKSLAAALDDARRLGQVVAWMGQYFCWSRP